MSHDHSHSNTSNRTDNIKVAFFLNFSFTIIELIGGYLTNSVAILSDAIHDLGDSLSLGMAWYFQKISDKRRDHSYTYGYRRFSLLGALINTFVLISGSIFILYETIPRLLTPEKVDAQGMVLFAILGIVANGLAVFRLKKGSSVNEKVVSLHLLEDVLGWTAVLIGAIIMNFFDVPILDPILSLAIASYILLNVFKSLKKVLSIFLQGTPENIDMEKVNQIILKNDLVKDIHDLHVWTMDDEVNIMTIHIITDRYLNHIEAKELKEKIRNNMKEMNIRHVTIEFETDEEIADLEHGIE